MRVVFCSLVLLVAAVLAAPTYLARVELSGSRDLAAVAQLGAPVVADVGDFCLVSAPDAQLSALDAAGFDITVLDRADMEDVMNSRSSSQKTVCTKAKA